MRASSLAPAAIVPLIPNGSKIAANHWLTVNSYINPNWLIFLLTFFLKR
jgi:hypothetical protein